MLEIWSRNVFIRLKGEMVKYFKIWFFKWSKMFQKGLWYLQIPETHFFAIFATFHHFLSFPTNKSKFFFTKTFLNRKSAHTNSKLHILNSIQIRIHFIWDGWRCGYRDRWLVLILLMLYFNIQNETGLQLKLKTLGISMKSYDLD